MGEVVQSETLDTPGVMSFRTPPAMDLCKLQRSLAHPQCSGALFLSSKEAAVGNGTGVKRAVLTPSGLEIFTPIILAEGRGSGQILGLEVLKF